MLLHTKKWTQIFRQIRVTYQCQKYYSSEVNSVPLTAERYPSVKRGNFAILEENDVKFFESILGSNRVLTQEDELNGNYFHFFRLRYQCTAL